jgi:tetratricopeptide (TPR) repeat protein
MTNDQKQRTKDKGLMTKTLDSCKTSVRIGLVAAIILALVFGWLAIRWQLGNMLAELTLPTEPNAEDAARLAISFAPDDPLANWLFANTKTATNDSAEGLEKVVKLSPNDFRWWVELGRAREQAENYEAAEKAFQKAVQLAPHYTFPHWQFGNFYLRRNRTDEAFAELKKAVENSTIYREQVFSIAWSYFDKDTAKLEQIAGDSPIVRADLVKFYAIKERPEDALRVWNTLSEEEKKADAAGANLIARVIYDKGFLREAIEFVRQIGIEPDAKSETIQNAGFEKPIGEAQDTYFGWKVAPIEKMEVKLDSTQKREGNRSLRVSFNGYADAALNNISQIITVEPSAQYRLSFWLRTENLKSGGTPTLEIYNPADTKNIATSAAFPVGTNDWQQLKIEFTAPQNAEAVVLRTTRAFCGNSCPIVGTFWYEDFKLEKIKW